MSKEDLSEVFGEDSDEDHGEEGSGEEEEFDEGDEEYEDDGGPGAQENPEQYKERLDAAKQHLRKKYHNELQNKKNSRTIQVLKMDPPKGKRKAPMFSPETNKPKTNTPPKNQQINGSPAKKIKPASTVIVPGTKMSMNSVQKTSPATKPPSSARERMMAKLKKKSGSSNSTKQKAAFVNRS